MGPRPGGRAPGAAFVTGGGGGGFVKGLRYWVREGVEVPGAASALSSVYFEHVSLTPAQYLFILSRRRMHPYFIFYILFRLGDGSHVCRRALYVSAPLHLHRPASHRWHAAAAGVCPVRCTHLRPRVCVQPYDILSACSQRVVKLFRISLSASDLVLRTRLSAKSEAALCRELHFSFRGRNWELRPLSIEA